MRIDPKFAAVHWEQAAIDQIASDLVAQGYQVSRGEQMGGMIADLVARRNGETIVYEFKVGGWSRERAQQAAAMRKIAVEKLKAQFRIILVNPPHQPLVEIEGLEQHLATTLREVVPPELDELSSNTLIEGVYGIEIAEVKLDREGLKITGEAIIEVRLQWGRGDDAADQLESFPFTFDVILHPEGGPDQVKAIDVDVSSWYGDYSRDTLQDRPQGRTNDRNEEF